VEVCDARKVFLARVNPPLSARYSDFLSQRLLSNLLLVSSLILHKAGTLPWKRKTKLGGREEIQEQPNIGLHLDMLHFTNMQDTDPSQAVFQLVTVSNQTSGLPFGHIL